MTRVAREPVEREPAPRPAWTPDTTVAGVAVRRQAADAASPGPLGPVGEPEGPDDAAAPEPDAAPGPLVVDDDAAPGPGAMRKTEFLAELRAEVCAAADDELARAGRSTDGCPFLDYWFDYYATKSAAHVERALRRWAPETAGATSARYLFPPVAARVRASVARWVATGEVSGIPDDAPMPPGGALGAVAGVFGAIASGVGRALSALGSLFGKARGGDRVHAGDPDAVRAGLGGGRPLDGAQRARMERAFGHDFGAVRVHDDARAAQLASSLGARAFTVGEHVAFGASEHRPGSPAGDALLAHELAHVVQQSGGPSNAAPVATEDAAERDADGAAASVVAALWGGGRGEGPRTRSGLALRRCATTGTTRTTTTGPGPAGGGGPTMLPADERPLMGGTEWSAAIEQAEGLSDEAAKRTALATLVAHALSGINVRVAVAGTSNTGQVDPADYAPAPVINFDANLNRKQSWPLSRGAQTRTLTRNYGYTFHVGSTAYSVIGPSTFNRQSPLYTRMHAQHELYHSVHHGPGAPGTDADQEVETYTNDFVNYFHQLHTFGPQWGPLIEKYEDATADARTAALDRLLAYRRTPPVPAGDVATIQAAFDRWLSRRRGDRGSSALVVDLTRRLTPAGTP